jgi:hypothetical protein
MVGLRLASRRPQQVVALIVQNANAYDEGVRQQCRALRGMACLFSETPAANFGRVG